MKGLDIDTGVQINMHCMGPKQMEAVIVIGVIDEKKGGVLHVQCNMQCSAQICLQFLRASF